MKKKLNPYIVVCPRCSSYLELIYTDGNFENYKCKKCSTEVTSPVIKDHKLKEVKHK
jgi:tRNA(Ile2) C34 agmatinyltransferase TiaS